MDGGGVCAQLLTLVKNSCVGQPGKCVKTRVTLSRSAFVFQGEIPHKHAKGSTQDAKGITLSSRLETLEQVRPASDRQPPAGLFTTPNTLPLSSMQTTACLQ